MKINILFSRVGIEPTISRFYSHTLCPCATTGLYIMISIEISAEIRDLILMAELNSRIYGYTLLDIYILISYKQKM